MLGAYSDEATPVLIPNTEVKLIRADGSDTAGYCESRSVPGVLISKYFLTGQARNPQGKVKPARADGINIVGYCESRLPPGILKTEKIAVIIHKCSNEKQSKFSCIRLGNSFFLQFFGTGIGNIFPLGADKQEFRVAVGLHNADRQKI